MTEGSTAALRAALIEAGREAGAQLTDDVSEQLLLYVPGEVRGRVIKLNKRIDELEAALASIVVNLQRHHPEPAGPVPAVIAYARAIRRGEPIEAAIAAGDAAFAQPRPALDREAAPDVAGDAVRAAGQAVIDQAFDFYTARNGRVMTIESDGEKCWIVPCDAFEELRSALANPRPALDRAVLTDLCAAMEYWAGCDEGVKPDVATSEIMSAGGAWPANAYGKGRAAIAATTINQPPAYLVWSNEHRAWWGADQRGYTRVIERAGRYARDEAYAIAAKRGGGWQAESIPYEIALPEADAIAQWQRRAGQ